MGKSIHPIQVQNPLISTPNISPTQILNIYSFPGHTSPILCAAFSPTGNLLATGSGDTNARLWDLYTETPSHVLSGHKGWVLCVEWEAMERKLATGGHDGHVRIFLFPFFSSLSTCSMFIILYVIIGSVVGSKNRNTNWRRTERTHEMGDFAFLGTNTYVRSPSPLFLASL